MDAILQGKETEPTQQFRIPVGDIERNRFQPRLEFDEEALEELANSIKLFGVIQPITVRKMGDGKYELISGERRWRASQKAKVKDIPAYVREANDEEMLEIALIENIQREELNPIEIALSYNRLIEELKIDQKSVSDKVGRKRATVANYLGLLRLSDAIQQSLRDGKISMGHAKPLKGFAEKSIPDRLLDIIEKQSLSVRQTEDISRELKKLSTPFLQKEVMNEIEDNQLSVKQIKELVKRMSAIPASETKKAPKPDRNEILLQDLARKLEEKFGNKIKLKQNNEGKGEISIPFSNNDDLQRILDILDI